MNLTVKSCIIKKTTIAVIVRAFYEKKTYLDYMFISFVLPDSFFRRVAKIKIIKQKYMSIFPIIKALFAIY